MKLSELKHQLSKFSDDTDVVLFTNGYYEINIVGNEDGVILSRKGKACPNVKSAVENKGMEETKSDLCRNFWWDF